MKTLLRAGVAVSIALLATSGTAAAEEILYAPENNRLHRIVLGGEAAQPATHSVLIENAKTDPQHGIDINGMICPLPDGSGRFIAGEDTGQPERPAGWGLFEASGRQVGKLVAPSQAAVPEPHGCAFDSSGRLFTTEIGDPGFLGYNGQLILWFPPFDHFAGPRNETGSSEIGENFCVIASDLGTPGGVAIDRDGRVYVAASSAFAIYRFSPPFPTSPDAAGGCSRRDEDGAPLADGVQREVFARGLATYSGLALAPNGHLYAASVATGEISEYDLDGRELRALLDPEGWLPPFATGTPQGLTVDSVGNLYYADLDLVWNFPTLGPGPDGKIWRIRFDSRGEPEAPEIVLRGLRFPDGLGVAVSPAPEREP